MLKTIFLLFPLLLFSCAMQKPKGGNPLDAKNDIQVTLECYTNVMPMSSGGSYVVIQIRSTADTLSEDFRVVALRATGKNGTWEAKDFDSTGFSGRGLQVYQNIARDFNSSIGSSNDFELEIESSSGKVCNYHFSAIPMVVVH